MIYSMLPERTPGTTQMRLNKLLWQRREKVIQRYNIAKLLQVSTLPVCNHLSSSLHVVSQALTTRAGFRKNAAASASTATLFTRENHLINTPWQYIHHVKKLCVAWKIAFVKAASKHPLQSRAYCSVLSKRVKDLTHHNSPQTLLNHFTSTGRSV